MTLLHLAIWLTQLGVSTCSPKTTPAEEVISLRIEQVYAFREKRLTHTWPLFSTQKLTLPIIYYTDSASYIANPTAKFIRQFHPLPVSRGRGVTLFKTASRFDHLPFHMEVSLTLGADTSAYDYKQPFIKCSSLETTAKIVLKLTQQAWLAMVLHESFHAFQFQYKAWIEKGFRARLTKV